MLVAVLQKSMSMLVGCFVPDVCFVSGVCFVLCFLGCVQFEFLAITKLETTKLVNNPMAGLVNTGENFWMGKVTPLA